MDIAIDKAKQTGMGMVTMARGGHVGMCAYHAMLALPHDMIGVCMTAATVTVPPTFGAKPRLGTNPIAVAAPARNEAAFRVRRGDQHCRHQQVPQRQAPPRRDSARHARHYRRHADYGADAGFPTSTCRCPWAARGRWGRTRATASRRWWRCCARCCRGRASSTATALTTIWSPPTPSTPSPTLTASRTRWTNSSGRSATRRPPPGQERVLYPGLYEAEGEAERTEHGIPLHYEAVEYIRTMCAEWGLPCSL